MQFVYPRSTKEFTRTRLETSVHSRIELEFENFGENRSIRRKTSQKKIKKDPALLDKLSFEKESCLSTNKIEDFYYFWFHFIPFLF